MRREREGRVQLMSESRLQQAIPGAAERYLARL